VKDKIIVTTYESKKITLGFSEYLKAQKTGKRADIQKLVGALKKKAS